MDATKGKAKKEPAPRAVPDHWRRQAKVSRSEHAAAVVTGGWSADQEITKRAYTDALARWRKGAA